MKAWHYVYASTLCLAVIGGLGPSGRAVADEHGANIPRLVVDPFWPKPLPDRWITGEVGGVCVDAHDHVFIVTRGNLDSKEEVIGKAAPPVIEFDQDGNVVNAWGNREL